MQKNEKFALKKRKLQKKEPNFYHGSRGIRQWSINWFIIKLWDKVPSHPGKYINL